MPTMTLRIDEETSRQLDQLATATDRSKSYLAQKALTDFLALNAWQVAEIQNGITEADAGQFIEHDDVKRKWEAKRANSLD